MSYLTPTAARTIADALPGLDALRTADDTLLGRALAQASDDVDVAMPYAGRKLLSTQSRQFPRAVEGASSGVWDWDANANAAIVPPAVLQAVVHQANAILSGGREGRLDNQHDGIAYDQAGAISESYKQGRTDGMDTGLCRRAFMLVREYRRRTGMML